MFQQTDEATAECIFLRRRAGEPPDTGTGGCEAYCSEQIFRLYRSGLCGGLLLCGTTRGNVYSRSYSDVTYQDVEESGFRRYLGDEYSRTKWFWAKDTLFGTDDYALFIGRYVRSLEYAHEPGIAVFSKWKMDFLREITGMKPGADRRGRSGCDRQKRTDLHVIVAGRF